MAAIRSTMEMTEGELKAWPTLGSLPTMVDERSLTIDSLPSFISSDSEEETATKTKADTPEWRRRATPHPSRSTGRSTSSSPSAPAIRAAPGLEDLVAPAAADSATRYDRCLLLQVRLQLSSLKQDKEEPLSISCQGRQQLRRSAAPEVKATAEAKAEAKVETKVEAESVKENAGKTTVMLRNLPNQCSRAMLAKFLSTTEFAGDFDLVYVPMDKTSGNNLGYSFINFIEATSCERFIKAMNGTKASKCFPGSRSGKVMQCNYAKVQGKEPYCMGLVNAASKLCAMGDEMAAWETMAPVPLIAAEGAKEQINECTMEFQGLRRDAPEFVPGQLDAEVVLEALSQPLPKLSAKACFHEEAAARARRYSSQLFVPGQMVAAA